MRKVISEAPFYTVLKESGVLVNPRTNETYTTDGNKVYSKGRTVGELERFDI